MKHISKLSPYIRAYYRPIIIGATMLPLVFISFTDDIVSYINLLFVSPFVSKLNNVIYPIIALALIACYYISKVDEQIPNKSHQVIILYATLLHTVCLFSNYWCYYSFCGNKITAYLNVIYIPAIIEFIRWVKHLNVDNTELSNQFFEIEKIDPSYDSYDRTGFINTVTEKLSGAFYKESSFAVGVTGQWGSGKSTMINIIKKQLLEKKEQGDTNIDVIIDFYPWYSDNPKKIIQDFLNVYIQNISVFIPDLSKELKVYLDLLLSKIEPSSTTKIISQLFENNQTNDLRDQYMKIRSALLQAKVKTVIFIDDLDRLDRDEIIEVMRLIRNTANFPYTQFVVTYDKDYVVGMLSNCQISNPDIYIEKIFNLEICLPKYEEEVICKELYRRFEDYLRIEELSKKEELFNMIYITSSENKTSENSHLLVPKVLTTQRDVIRFFNSFTLLLEAIKKQRLDKKVETRDLFYLELLKYRYRPLYNILKDAPTHILKREDSEFSRYVFVKTNSEYQNYPLAEETLRSYTPYQVNIAKDLLYCLFETHRSGSINSIYSVRAKDRYFSFITYKRNFDTVEFSGILSTETNDYKTTIEPTVKNWLNNKNYEEVRYQFEKCLRGNIAEIFDIYVQMLESDNTKVKWLAIVSFVNYAQTITFTTETNLKYILQLLDMVMYLRYYKDDICQRYSIEAMEAIVANIIFVFDRNEIGLDPDVLQNRRRLLQHFYSSARSRLALFFIVNSNFAKQEKKHEGKVPLLTISEIKEILKD